MIQTCFAPGFNIEKKIGSGSFGEVYLGVHSQKNVKIAIKVQNRKQKRSSLLSEAKYLKDLQKSVNETDYCVPICYDFGKKEGRHFIIMDYLGKNLQKKFEENQKIFSPDLVLSLGIKMLNIIQYVHSKNIIHRDIKPQNFLLTRENDFSKIFLIDFGLATYFREKNGDHYQCKLKQEFTGNIKYSSKNAQLKISQSRRDDLEAIAYVLIYFSTGSLPWEGVKKTETKSKYSIVLEKKAELKPKQLCKGLPQCFSIFLKYCRNLKFEENPDYEYLRTLLQKELNIIKQKVQ